MSSAKITLYGIADFTQRSGGDLFTPFAGLPEGIDKDTLIDTILMRGAEFEVVYPDPGVMQYFISTWVDKHRRTFEKWVAALSIEYDPLYNYDRHEEWTDHAEGSLSGTSTNTDETTTKVSAYDAADFSNRNRVNGEGESTTETSNENDATHEGHLYGNIGVTTSQQMLESELDLARWNLYEHIADLFVEEFCVMVYE